MTTTGNPVTTAPEGPSVASVPRTPIAPVRRAPSGLAADVRAVRIVCHRELLRWYKDRGRMAAGLVSPCYGCSCSAPDCPGWSARAPRG